VVPTTLAELASQLLRITVVAALARAYNVFGKFMVPGPLMRKVAAAAVGF
jgi:hypothetical protein